MCKHYTPALDKEAEESHNYKILDNKHSSKDQKNNIENSVYLSCLNTRNASIYQKSIRMPCKENLVLFLVNLVKLNLNLILPLITVVLIFFLTFLNLQLREKQIVLHSAKFFAMPNTVITAPHECFFLKSLAACAFLSTFFS